MTLGLQLALVAVTLWVALGIAGERAHRLLWALPWICVGLCGLLLQWVAHKANGTELPA